MQATEAKEGAMKYPRRSDYPNYRQYALAKRKWRVQNKQMRKQLEKG